MENPKIYLVRSPANLISENQAGHGWSQINFSEASSVEELLGLFSDKGINPGRRRKQIKRFFSISKGDIVVVPLHGAVVFGFATGTRSYAKGVSFGENRIGVEFLCHKDGSVMRVPRKDLPEALSTRLRIRMAVVSLNEFEDDILRIIDQIQTNGGSSFDSHIQALEAESLTNIRGKLLANIRAGNTNLESGGRGLEKLVAELFSTEGYTTKIFSKRAHEGIADADVEAIRTDRFTSSRLLIQVKHHSGTTGLHAIRQLQKLDSDDDTELFLITTADISSEIQEEAESQGIGVMDGESFVEWIVEQAHKLSPATLNQLGLSTVPSLLI